MTEHDQIVLAAVDVPVALRRFVDARDQAAILVAIERLADGRLVLQTVPGLDPTAVAQLRKVLAQHADVLRRLT